MKRTVALAFPLSRRTETISIFMKLNFPLTNDGGGGSELARWGNAEIQGEQVNLGCKLLSEAYEKLQGSLPEMGTRDPVLHK